MAADRDDGREPPRVRLDRHVVRRGDQHRALKIGRVGELVEHVAELALRGREAHVDDVELLLDRPAEPGEQRLARAFEPGAEHAHGVDLRVGRERPDDAGAGSAVAAEIALDVLLGDRLALRAERDRDRALNLADEGMAALDAAVEDADADARAGRALDRPGAVDLLGQRVDERDLCCRLARQRPGGKEPFLAHSTSAARRARRARSSSSPTARLISTRCAAAARGAAGEQRCGLEVGPVGRVDALCDRAGEDRDVRARLGDREGYRCGSVEHLPEGEVAARVGRLRARRPGTPPGRLRGRRRPPRRAAAGGSASASACAAPVASPATCAAASDDVGRRRTRLRSGGPGGGRSSGARGLHR